MEQIEARYVLAGGKVLMVPSHGPLIKLLHSIADRDDLGALDLRDLERALHGVRHPASTQQEQGDG